MLIKSDNFYHTVSLELGFLIYYVL